MVLGGGDLDVRAEPVDEERDRVPLDGEHASGRRRLDDGDVDRGERGRGLRRRRARECGLGIGGACHAEGETHAAENRSGCGTNHRSRLVGKVHANAAPMRSGLMRFTVGAALLMVSSRAMAEDSGAVGVDEDAAALCRPGTRAFVDGAMIACEGGLCETQTGTTCAIAGASPGRISPSAAGPFAILAVLALAAGRRRADRPTALAAASGRSAHLAEGWTGQRVPPGAGPENDAEKVTTSMGFYKRL